MSPGENKYIEKLVTARFPMADFEDLMDALRAASNPKRKKYLASYFGTEPSSGFVGLTAVAARRVAVRCAPGFDLPQLRRLLASGVPEHRYVALKMLVWAYERRPAWREAIARFYLSNLRRVDHWVLVDASAPYILGAHLLDRPGGHLFRLARSRRPEERRIAIVATWVFIRAGDFADTLRLAELLLQDEDPLIHRAVGWMLREVGKRSPVEEKTFLKRHAGAMPRLMLRCAVERLPPSQRRHYLAIRRTEPPAAGPRKRRAGGT
jgi:3-methyladenine DNA glycosylase AlkD